MFFHDDFVNPWTALAALAVKNYRYNLRFTFSTLTLPFQQLNKSSNLWGRVRVKP